ncbi:MAG TPA: GntR family transcriptional regulator [Nocardioides sp.]|nr:GntR family transcriptional regulator [Nocardioides sp.]
MTSVNNNAPRPLSKVEYVLQRLREDIANGEIPAGTSLRQMELAQRYGVSATPVREALRLLEADGSIQYSQHRGVTVSEMPPEGIHDLYRLRSLAEGLAVELAVERMQPGQLERIIARHDELAATHGRGAPVELSRMNKAFHFSIYESGSTVVTNYLTQIWTALPASKTIWQDEDWAQVLLAEHRQILAAIEAGDAVEAGRRMAAHVMTSERFRQEQSGS